MGALFRVIVLNASVTASPVLFFRGWAKAYLEQKFYNHHDVSVPSVMPLELRHVYEIHLPLLVDTPLLSFTSVKLLLKDLCLV